MRRTFTDALDVVEWMQNGTIQSGSVVAWRWQLAEGTSERTTVLFRAPRRVDVY